MNKISWKGSLEWTDPVTVTVTLFISLKHYVDYLHFFSVCSRIATGWPSYKANLWQTKGFLLWHGRSYQLFSAVLLLRTLISAQRSLGPCKSSTWEAQNWSFFSITPCLRSYQVRLSRVLPPYAPIHMRGIFISFIVWYICLFSLTLIGRCNSPPWDLQ